MQTRLEQCAPISKPINKSVYKIIIVTFQASGARIILSYAMYGYSSKNNRPPCTVSNF